VIDETYNRASYVGDAETEKEENKKKKKGEEMKRTRKRNLFIRTILRAHIITTLAQCERYLED